MPFHLTSDQELIRKTVRELAEEIGGKPAEHIDRERLFPKEALGKLATLGLMGMLVPADKGGAGTDTVSYALALEEVARASGTVALALNTHNALGTFPIALHATETVAGAVLPPLLTGEKLVAWALSEPGAGSDIGGLQTRAEKVDGGYELSGIKSFVVAAPQASWLVVFASVKDAGLTAFLVPAEAEGVRVAPAERTMAFRGSDMAQVFLRNVHVPEEHRLGEEGAGERIAAQSLLLGKLGAAAIAIGLMQASFEAAVQYSGEREQFRTPIKKFQAIQWAVSNMDVSLRASRLLTYAAADKHDRGEDASVEIAAAKLYAADASKQLTQRSLLIHGGTGFMRDMPVERLNRDARATSIYAGTSEMQRAQLAAKALDL